jgi:hypothetical protein
MRGFRLPAQIPSQWPSADHGAADCQREWRPRKVAIFSSVQTRIYLPLGSRTAPFRVNPGYQRTMQLKDLKVGYHTSLVVSMVEHTGVSPKML